jgi:hypothetical protein
VLTDRVLIPTCDQRSQYLINVASVPYVVHLNTRLFFINSVDDAIAPDSIGTVSLKFAGQFCTDCGFIQQGIDSRSHQPFDIRSALNSRAAIRIAAASMIACATAGADVVDVAIDSALIGLHSLVLTDVWPRYVRFDVPAVNGCRVHGARANSVGHGYSL